MTNAEYLQTQQQLLFLANLVKGMDLPAFITAGRKAESVGPILDPTLYRDAASNLADILILAESLNGFRASCLSLLAKAECPPPGPQRGTHPAGTQERTRQ